MPPIIIEGIRAALGPVSTIAGAALLHSTFLKAAELLARQGKPPDVFVSANLESVTIDDLKKSLERYQQRIRYYRPGGDGGCD